MYPVIDILESLDDQLPLELPGRPPPDGGTSLLTSVECRRRQLRRNWLCGRHGRPRKAGALPDVDG